MSAVKYPFEGLADISIHFSELLPKPLNHPFNPNKIIITTDFEDRNPGIFEYDLISNESKCIYKYDLNKFTPEEHGHFIHPQSKTLLDSFDCYFSAKTEQETMNEFRSKYYSRSNYSDFNKCESDIFQNSNHFTNKRTLNISNVPYKIKANELFKFLNSNSNYLCSESVLRVQLHISSGNKHVGKGKVLFKTRDITNKVLSYHNSPYHNQAFVIQGI